MSTIIDNKVIKEGKIIDNYLVNFPQFINKEKNSLYKLVIGEQVTVFKIEIPSLEYGTIRLPFYPFTEENTHNVFVSWGDGQVTKDNNIPEILEHTYRTPGKYQIFILGDTPNLFSIKHKSENGEEISNYLYNFQYCLIGVTKLSDKLTDLTGIFKCYPNLKDIPDEALPFHAKNCNQLFANCLSLEYIPFNFTLPGEGISFKSMFDGSGIKYIMNQNLNLPFKTNNIQRMFANTKIESIPYNFFQNVTSNLTEAKAVFYNCTQLQSLTSNKILKYITNINDMFYGCEKIKNISLQLPNLKRLERSFYNCKSLKTVEGIQINQLTKGAASAFQNCYNLEIDINNILEYNNLDITTLDKTFYNCDELKGYVKEQYLWKSKEMCESLNQINTFYHCTSLTNYNFITKEWGGPEKLNYWYGSYELNIDNENEIYCLPLYKFKIGDSKSNTNQAINLLNYDKDLLNEYDFYINYGDDSVWSHINIGNTEGYYNIWENDKTNPFYGYPLTYKINYNKDGSINSHKDLAYDTLMQKYFSYIFKDITHIYKKPGKYKIMIIGKLPRFYVQEKDIMTNRQLHNIITINKLPLTTLDHAFTNAVNLRYLPNEDLTKFPLVDVGVVSGDISWEYDSNAEEGQRVTITPSLTQDDQYHIINNTAYCFSIRDGYTDNIINIPPLFKINETIDNNESITFKNRPNIKEES